MSSESDPFREWYSSLFHTFQLTDKGYVSGREVFGLLITSKLHRSVLAQIWDEVKKTGDPFPDGLTLKQFISALQLISAVQSGRPVMMGVIRDEVFPPPKLAWPEGWDPSAKSAVTSEPGEELPPAYEEAAQEPAEEKDLETENKALKSENQLLRRELAGVLSGLSRPLTHSEDLILTLLPLRKQNQALNSKVEELHTLVDVQKAEIARLKQECAKSKSRSPSGE